MRMYGERIRGISNSATPSNRNRVDPVSVAQIVTFLTFVSKSLAQVRMNDGLPVQGAQMIVQALKRLPSIVAGTLAEQI